MEPMPAAERILAEEEPGAACAFLGSSVLGSGRTPTSDLDLVVVTVDDRAPVRRVFRAHGWPVEIFRQNEAGLRGYWAKDARSRVLALLRVVADGVPVGVPTELGRHLQSDARGMVDAGPAALSVEETKRRRFLVGDLIDDLVGCRSDVERPYVANALLTHVAELALLSRRRWIGGDKWLGRELAAYDGALARTLAGGHASAVLGDTDALITAARTVLDGVGGPFPEGYSTALAPVRP